MPIPKSDLEPELFDPPSGPRMSATATVRKYALTRLASGDYLLPSNDGTTLWRIASYTEGPSSGITDWPRDRKVWGLWKWEKPIRQGGYVDTEDWNRWEMWEGMFDSRREAVNAALAVPEREETKP